MDEKSDNVDICINLFEIKQPLLSATKVLEGYYEIDKSEVKYSCTVYISSYKTRNIGFYRFNFYPF